MSTFYTNITGDWLASTATTTSTPITSTPKTQRTTISDIKFEPSDVDWFNFYKSYDMWDKALEELLKKYAEETKRVPDPIKKVVFNYPATIVFWKDGTKTVVKCQYGEAYDKEKGIALCFMKKFFGNKGNFNDIFRKYIEEEDD